MKRKNIIKVSVVSLRPYMMSGFGIYELGGHAHPLPGFTNTTLDDITGAKFLSDYSNIRWPVLISKGRISGDNRKRSPEGQCRDGVFGEPVREILLFRITPDVLEWQDRDGRIFK